MWQRSSCIQDSMNPHTLHKWVAKERKETNDAPNDGSAKIAKNHLISIRYQRLYKTDGKLAYLHLWQNNSLSGKFLVLFLFSM